MHFKTNQLKFSLKLILSQSAILVEYPGREPQLFMPTLLNNKIVLRNIIFDHINLPNSDGKPKHEFSNKKCRSEADTVRRQRRGKPNSSTSGDSTGVCGDKSSKYVASRGNNGDRPNNECSESMHSTDNTKSEPPDIDSSKLAQFGDSYYGKTLMPSTDRFHWVRSGKTKKLTPYEEKQHSSTKATPIAGPAIKPTIVDYQEQLRQQLKKVHSHVLSNPLPPFEGMRSSYQDKELKPGRRPLLRKKANTRGLVIHNKQT